ncbi:MAG: hypothetical protein VZR27_09500 [Acutalibacteraceae bacterium]|nr:hypothetical protein [Acutalibacteraceae bacterium]
MISAKCIFKYREQYPNDRCYIGEPGSRVMIDSKSSNKTFISPSNEDDKTFLERLEKSKQHNHNYFYEEWKTFQYEKDMMY